MLPVVVAIGTCLLLCALGLSSCCSLVSLFILNGLSRIFWEVDWVYVELNGLSWILRGVDWVDVGLTGDFFERVLHEVIGFGFFRGFPRFNGCFTIAC